MNLSLGEVLLFLFRIGEIDMKQQFKGWHTSLRMMEHNKEVPEFFIDETPIHPLTMLNELLKGTVPLTLNEYQHKYKLLKYTNYQYMRGHKLFLHDIVVLLPTEATKNDQHYYIIEASPGGFVFKNLYNGEIIEMMEYARGVIVSDNQLAMASLIGSADTHPDILERFNYNCDTLPTHEYRTYGESRSIYYKASDLLSRYNSPPFIHTPLKVINDILKSRYTPTLKFVPYTGAHDFSGQKIFEQDILREVNSNEFFIVFELAGGFVLKSIKGNFTLTMASFFKGYHPETSSNLLSNFEIVGKLYNREKFVDECGMNL